MNDHNLDDLIIDNIAPKNRKTKSFLTIIALFIVVLIVAIILTRILLKTPDNNQLVLEDTTELIAPELKLQEKPHKVEKVDEPSLQSIIEEEIKAPEVKVAEPVAIPKPVKVEKKEIEIPKPEPVKVPKVEEKIPAPVKVEKKEVPVVKKPVETKPAVKKPVVKEPVATKPVIKKPVAAQATQYYIQVGSFSKDPSARFLSVIKNSGFEYHITRADTRGTKKLHIGPYKTRADVNVALKQVKDRINKSAFVIKK